MAKRKKQERLYLTISEEDKALLEEWAAQQGRHLTNLGTWLIERSLRDAIASGEFVPRQNKAEIESLAVAYVLAVGWAGAIGVLDLQKLADALKIPSDRLAVALKHAKGKIKNGNAHEVDSNPGTGCI